MRYSTFSASRDGCKDCGHLTQYTLDGKPTCGINRKPDGLGVCAEFYNAHIVKTLTGCARCF